MRRLLVISDVHSNRAALEAVLKDAGQHGPFDVKVNAGDMVGYGPDPNEVVDMIRSSGFISVEGNHDESLFILPDFMNMKQTARDALKKNEEELSPDNLEYLRRLQKTPYVDPARQFAMVHGSFTGKEDDWREYTERYVLHDGDIIAAMRALNFKGEHITLGIIGHTHIPAAAYGWVDCQKRAWDWDSPAEKFGQLDKVFRYDLVWGRRDVREDVSMRVQFGKKPASKRKEKADWQRKIIFNPGSVGQPRNHCPLASYGIVEVEKDTYILHLLNVPYDVRATQAMMKKKGFDDMLIERLAEGQ